MIAGLTHYVSPERLLQIVQSIPKTYILTGDDDNLIRPVNSERIYSAVQGCKEKVEYMVWNKTGHAIHVQHEKKFNELVERACEEGRKLSDAA